jgi:hypothetical protein
MYEHTCDCIDPQTGTWDFLYRAWCYKHIMAELAFAAYITHKADMAELYGIK